ncbi:probable tyrosyl-DNA phosphodiesterase isoform X2 [Macrosteles quadrilineatus]|uniref:probable tyrosyl-DNA phosphodiesterase isoform X2 n=1 Tax=Macrosteles quadrilineatus TaxID=74068 RepID=UPI0023E15C3A|nr:probable tyrosyl-DNA phosphodiesterase isoform X2 [Macrosteles quadrilineatus]
MKDSEDQESSTVGDGNRKTQCSYGEGCYRKNPSHFEEFEHRHLDLILESFKRTGSDKLPDNVKPRISPKTLQEQLEILKKLSTNKESPSVRPNNAETGSSNNTSFGRKRLITAEGIRDSLDNSPLAKREKSSSGSRNDSGNNSSNNNDIKKTMATQSSPVSSEEHRRRMQESRNIGEAMKYIHEAKKRSQGKICEKLKAASPYNFFLTSITDSKKTHTEPLSLLMHDILDPSLGDLESSLQINFMVEFGWLVAQYHIAGQRGKPITLLYGQMDVANLSFPNVTAVEIKCPSPFGSHHTKMCVLAYRDGSVRVCVHTANLVESDWDNRAQGVWLSPLCPALSLDADSAAGESPTNFKQDLMQYLSAYRRPELQPWLGKLRRADFSNVNVFFVASTPGSHKGVDRDKWGLPKLAGLLRTHARIKPRSDAPPRTWQIIVQCSSIGSLGPQPTSWFCGEVKSAMSNGVGMGVQSPPPIRLVYPSFDNVAASHDGLLGGGGLPYSRRTHEKQEWLKQYLFQWKCDSRHRTKAMPHIKTYTRISPDLSELAWFHLTSANLSKAAWGSTTKAGATTILSYEAGVLFIPKFVTGTLSFPVSQVTGGAQEFPMPYDVPLTPYTSSDVPWFMDNLT